MRVTMVVAMVVKFCPLHAAGAQKDPEDAKGHQPDEHRRGHGDLANRASRNRGQKPGNGRHQPTASPRASDGCVIMMMVCHPLPRQ